MAIFDTVYTVKREISKEQFTRALLIKLAQSEDAPTDICTAKLGEIRESVNDVIFCEGHVETDFTASVGYTREEEYWDYEKRGDSMVRVKKKRKVTDWQPYSGHLNGDKKVVCFNRPSDDYDEALEESELALDALRTTSENNIEKKGVAEVSSSGLSMAKKMCATAMELDIRYPGDVQKDKKASSSVTINELECYKAPYYDVRFTYGDRDYAASGFACGTPNVMTELPPNNVDAKAIANKETKGFKVGMIISWLSVLAAFIAAVAVGGLVWIAPAALLVLAIVITVVGNSKYNKILFGIKNNNKALKKEGLKAALASLGLGELTPEEEERF